MKEPRYMNNSELADLLESEVASSVDLAAHDRACSAADLAAFNREKEALYEAARRLRCE